MARGPVQLHRLRRLKAGPVQGNVVAIFEDAVVGTTWALPTTSIDAHKKCGLVLPQTVN